MKPLNPKKFALRTRIDKSGATVPVNTGWHSLKTLKPVKREVKPDDDYKKRFNYHLKEEDESCADD